MLLSRWLAEPTGASLMKLPSLPRLIRHSREPKRAAQELPRLIALPPAPQLTNPAGVQAYAAACFAAAGLADWGFGWDRAVSRLGCCRPQQKMITLSRHFVACYLAKDAGMVVRVLLHEMAHALSWEHSRATGHGPVWKAFCSALGIPDEKATVRCEPFEDPVRRPYRWVLRLSTTGEVVRYYHRRPPSLTPRRLAACYIPGRRRETYGKLILQELRDSQAQENPRR